MSFATTIRKGVALADKLTASLQVTVKHYHWTGTGDQGEAVYTSNYTPRKAVVEYHQRLRRLVGGQEVMQQAVITFPRPILAHGATGRVEPIDSRDKLVLPDGNYFPILDVEGVLDPKTGKPYAFVVILGAKATL
jgi:hypothetical protein